MSLIYLEKINSSYRAQFEKKVIEIAGRLKINPNWLMQVMKSESGLNPQAQNKSKKDGHLIAAGLIQWTKASGLKGAPQSVLQLSGLQQLDLVEQYFKPYAGKMNSYFDVYLITFFPAAVGKNDSYVFKTSKYSPALVASQNPAININKDGQITMGEFKQYVLKTVPSKLHDIVFKGLNVVKDVVTSPAGGALSILAIATAIFF